MHDQKPYPKIVAPLMYVTVRDPKTFLLFLMKIMKLLYMPFDLHTPVFSVNIGFYHLQTDFEAFLIDKLAV
jgi:hypothetical protein